MTERGARQAILMTPPKSQSASSSSKAQTFSESALTGKIETELELLQRHVEILKAVKKHEPIGIIRLSEVTGHPQHKVRYSLRILEQEGLIEPSQHGAITTPHLNEFIPHLRNLLNMMTETVQELKRAIE